MKLHAGTCVYDTPTTEPKVGAVGPGMVEKDTFPVKSREIMFFRTYIN